MRLSAVLVLLAAVVSAAPYGSPASSYSLSSRNHNNNLERQSTGIAGNFSNRGSQVDLTKRRLRLPFGISEKIYQMYPASRQHLRVNVETLKKQNSKAQGPSLSTESSIDLDHHL
ncbi:hypothetical protein BC835DRAFT_1357448 [Cytidiella melzeri]|nr:hypothetical protein BC835DRAFT_1378897 [Cytidiella melzeri]KAI0692382.1 hypothetical protein BC835DRAFT_1357448 [Cytidiella melzeri]